MKDKIVFWGTNEKNQNVLVTLRLRAADNKVDIWMFDRAKITPEFAEKIFEDWENIDPKILPEPYEYLEHDMSSPSILPDTILANNTDMINRAEKEWYVKILATKLSMKLQEEVVQLGEQVSSMVKYDKDTWALAKDYWDKINKHFQSRDLTREQTANLRDMINKAFDKLKKLRKNSNEEFEQKAKENADIVLKKINAIVGEVANSRNLNGLFDTLKQMQLDLRKTRLTQELDRTVRDKMNEAFQLVKEARRNHRNNRLNNRIKGLDNAIFRMEKSTRRDEEDLAFQNRRVQASEGKLEKQLREAKIVMIEERLKSKKVKLEDMYKTMKELKDRIRQDEEREIEREKQEKIKAEQRAKREAARKAKKAARAKAAAEAEAAQKLKEQQEAEAAAKAKADEANKISVDTDDLKSKENAVEKVAEEIAANEKTVEVTEDTVSAKEEVAAIETDTEVTSTESVSEEVSPIEVAVADIAADAETIESQAEAVVNSEEITNLITEETVTVEDTPLTPVEAGVVDEEDLSISASDETITEHAVQEVIAEGDTTETLVEEATTNDESLEMASTITPLIEEEKLPKEEAEAESLEVDDILSSSEEE